MAHVPRAACSSSTDAAHLLLHPLASSRGRTVRRQKLIFWIWAVGAHVWVNAAMRHPIGQLYAGAIRPVFLSVHRFALIPWSQFKYAPSQSSINHVAILLCKEPRKSQELQTSPLTAVSKVTARNTIAVRHG